MLDLRELHALSEADLIEKARENPEWYRGILAQVALAAEQDRKECQLAYYQIANPDAIKVHTSTAREIACVGGNRSSKSDTSLAELSIRATGHLPLSLLDSYPLDKIKGAIRARIVCNSLTDTWPPVIRPKLQWDHWNGVGDPAEGRGHWGWIPRHCLTGSTWEKAYSERYRTLHVSFCTRCAILPCTGAGCRGCAAGMDLTPDQMHKWPQRFAGTSTIQVCCLAPETPVLRPDGTWTPLSGIRIGDYVETRDGARLVTAVHAYESAPRVRIKLWSGPELIATPNHRHFLASGEERTTDQLKVGDVLALADVEPEKCDPLAERWRLGWTAVMIGDGHMSHTPCFTAVPDSRVTRDMPPLPPNTRLVPASAPTAQHRLVGTAGAPCHRGLHNPLTESLRADGLWGLRSYEKYVPAWVFRQPLEGVEYFLRHLWNTDGTGDFGMPSSKQASMYTTTSARLASDVQRLLWRLGYSAGITTFMPTDRVCGQNAITGTDIISRRRVYRVQTSWTSGRLRGRIRSIEPIEPGPVACLTVDGNHEFVANGLATGNSYDQDISAFAGSSMHLILHDEMPPSDVYRENRLRTLDVQGQIITAFTPPDEIGASRTDAAWFHEDIYEPGLPGPQKHPLIDTVILFTERNRILDAKAIAEIASTLTEEQRETRLHGKFMHLSGVVFKHFTDHSAWWCFRCNKRIALPVEGRCYTCHGDDVVEYSHVSDAFPIPSNWPIVFVADPHPRKPDALGWFALAPSDDIFMIENIEQDGTPDDVARAVREIEDRLPNRPVKRLMDPNIATETNDKMQRGWTMRKAYDAVGLRCDLANDEINVGIQNVEELLRPDKATRRPRFQLFRHCGHAIQGMKRWAWDEWTRQGDKEPKEKVREKHKDHCDLIRYMANDRPSYAGYTRGMMFHHRGHR